MSKLSSQVQKAVAAAIVTAAASTAPMAIAGCGAKCKTAKVAKCGACKAGCKAKAAAKCGACKAKCKAK